MFWREKHTKMFLMELLCIACLGMTAAFLLMRAQETRVRGLLFEHDAAIAAALLEDGMEERAAAETIAGAYDGDWEAYGAVQGEMLLHRIGLSEKTDVRLIPCLYKFFMRGRIAAVLSAAFFFTMLLFCIWRYLQKRDKIYREAIDAIENCGEDDFSLKLPELYDGTLYQLFFRINFMADMLKTRQKAENRAKEFLKQMMADISHQLKTPLAALLLYQEIIQSDPEQAETVAFFAEKSERTIVRTEGLIGALLKIARLDAGSVKFHKKMMDAGELVLAAAEELTDRAEKEKKELSFSGAAGAKVYCDPDWTKEALSNLIKNALDYTDRGDRICIAWEQSPLMTRLTVADTGEGIAAEDIHHVFKRFYKSGDGRESQAAGLGLSLAKSIADGQGGTIEVRSDAGQGAAFILAFPN